MTETESYFYTGNNKVTETEICEYVLQRVQDVKCSNKIKNIIAFHAANKYMLMAHDQLQLKILGNIVASYKKIPLSEIIEDYENHLRLAMSKTPTTKTHTNVIMHVFGYFLKYLNQNEKQLFLDRLEQFREGKMTLGNILLEISHTVYRFDNTYLTNQTYFLLYSNIDNKNIFSAREYYKI